MRTMDVSCYCLGTTDYLLRCVHLAIDRLSSSSKPRSAALGESAREADLYECKSDERACCCQRTVLSLPVELIFAFRQPRMSPFPIPHQSYRPHRPLRRLSRRSVVSVERKGLLLLSYIPGDNKRVTRLTTCHCFSAFLR